MIRREGDSLLLEGAITLDTVPGLVDAVEEHLRQGVSVVDFNAVTEVDSAAVALALEWLRQAGRAGKGLRLANLPAGRLQDRERPCNSRILTLDPAGTATETATEMGAATETDGSPTNPHQDRPSAPTAKI